MTVSMAWEAKYIFLCPQTLLRFVKDTEQESRRVAERYDDLRKSWSKRPKYKKVTNPNLVATGHTAFVAAQKKLEKKEEAKKKRAAAKKVTQPVAAKKQAKKR